LKRILVTSQVGQQGFILPNLGLARALVEAGHQVYFHAAPWSGDLARRAGCVPLAAPLGDALDVLLGRKRGSIRETYQSMELDAGIDALRHIEKHQLDAVIVHGYGHFGPALAAQRAQLPWITFAAEPWILSRAAQRSGLAKMDTNVLRAHFGLPSTRRNSMQECFSTG